jgi:hypothetical protein
MVHVINRRIPVVVAAFALASMVSLGSAISMAEEAEGEHHPHIHAALRELREAKEELKTAAHDFGGHRADAVDAVEHAIKQLRKALESDPGAREAKRSEKEAGTEASTGEAKHGEGRQAEQGEHHPHIRAALKELREAKAELETAAHDFGGHRADAIKAVEHAIRQLEKALEFDAK